MRRTKTEEAILSRVSSLNDRGCLAGEGLFARQRRFLERLVDEGVLARYHSSALGGGLARVDHPLVSDLDPIR